MSDATEYTIVAEAGYDDPFDPTFWVLLRDGGRLVGASGWPSADSALAVVESGSIGMYMRDLGLFEDRLAESERDEVTFYGHDMRDRHGGDGDGDLPYLQWVLLH